MVTGLLLFIPLTTASYINFKKAGALDSLSTVLCMVVGLAIQPILDFVKNRGLKKQA